MRIDLHGSTRRPLPIRAVQWVISRIVGMSPGPLLTFTYDLELVHPRLSSYMFRGVRDAGPWNKGESELIGAFVSRLNSCQF